MVPSPPLPHEEKLRRIIYQLNALNAHVNSLNEHIKSISYQLPGIRLIDIETFKPVLASADELRKLEDSKKDLWKNIKTLENKLEEGFPSK